MKRTFISSLIVLSAICGIAFGTVIKETKQGESITFYANESGTVEKKAELTSTGQLRVSEVTDLAGTGTPPGMVPLGGMVAVMPSVTGAWQPPATGVVKDGFMRADGATVADSGSPMNGQVLPNMVNSFARGSTTSSIVPAGGSDSITPTGTVSQPTFAGTAAARIDWFKTQAVSATNPEHYHSAIAASGTANDLTAAGQTYTGNSGSVTSDSHSHTLQTGGVNRVAVVTGSGTAGFQYNASGSTFQATGTNTDSHSHTVSIGHTHAASTVSGYAGCQGVAGCVDGDAAQTIAFNANNDNMNEWAAAGDYTPTGTVSQPTFTGDSHTNMPVYNNVVWVIRVK